MDEVTKLLTPKKKKTVTFKGGLSTGSTLLNLACTDKPFVGFLPGHIYYFVGDSKSGKTFITLTCLAEAARNPDYDSYRFIFDQPEVGALMDVKRFFGSKVDKRLEPPRKYPNGTPRYSSSAEEFYDHIDDAINEGEPFIYILDSMDALSSTEEEKVYSANKKARRGKGKAKGSYGMGKAKTNSSGLRRANNLIKQSGSIIIIISQTRDNIDPFTSKGRPKTRAGGRALTFYATLELWSSVVGGIRTAYKGKKHKVGSIIQIKALKNRITGKEEQAVKIPIYPSYGFDDLGGCIDFLVQQGHWKKVKGGGEEKEDWGVTEGKFNAPEFDFTGTREQLVTKLDGTKEERTLKRLVGQVWAEIQDALSLKRKPRYQ